MKFKRILPLAGVLTLLAGGAAFAQMNIPAGAGAGVYRPAPGTPVGRAVNPTYSRSCTQQANAQGLHGTAWRAFRERCRRSGGR
jgi:hypothetical protein